MNEMKILLVDDELDFLKIMGARIKSWGYKLIKSSNGKEAIEIVKAEKPDIVLLDYMLPEMDGIAILKEIRKMDNDLPVIMFTAHPDIKAIKGSEELGVSAFIPKLSTYSDTQLILKAAIYIVRKKILKDN